MYGKKSSGKSMLKGKQKSLPPALKKKILASTLLLALGFTKSEIANEFYQKEKFSYFMDCSNQCRSPFTWDVLL